MPPLPSRKTLEAMKRVDLQKLCKDYGVKANLKSEALIDLLLDTQSAAPSRRNTSTSSHSSIPPTRQRDVSTRQPSRAGPSRITSLIIHEVDEEVQQNTKLGERETSGKADNVGPDYPPDSAPEKPHQQSSSLSMASHRTRRAKELQRRLGVGKPIAAGGAGPRAVTRSTTSSRGKQTRLNRSLKLEAAIPEEETTPGSSSELGKNRETDNNAVASVKPALRPSSSLASLAVIDECVAKALRPLHEQLQTLRSELEQMHFLKVELAQLKGEMESLKSRTPANHDHNLVTPEGKTISPKKPHGLGGLGVPSTVKIRNAQMSNIQGDASNVVSRNQGTLGKRPREPSIPRLEERDNQGESEEDRDDAPPLKKAKVSQDSHPDIIAGMVDDVNQFEEYRRSAPQQAHTPGFTVFRESNEPPDSGTAHLSDYFIMPSPPDTVSASEYTRHETNGPENQNPFSFSYSTNPSTPTLQPDAQHRTRFNMPAFYTEQPRSPTPSGSGPGRHAVVDAKGADIFQLFDSPHPSRSVSRVPSTINPTVLTTGKGTDTSLTSNEVATGLGLRTISSSSIISASVDAEDAPLMRLTMYGTELDGDTRFGDFGVEGVATGFWTGGRF